MNSGPLDIQIVQDWVHLEEKGAKNFHASFCLGSIHFQFWEWTKPPEKSCATTPVADLETLWCETNTDQGGSEEEKSSARLKLQVQSLSLVGASQVSSKLTGNYKQ